MSVEAALITPLVCLIVFGAVEFGFYFKEAHTVSSAATRGARELSALPKQGGYQLRVAKLTSNALSVLNGDDPPLGGPLSGCDPAAGKIDCWVQAQFHFPTTGFTGWARPNDTTTWTASIKGSPVRLVGT